MIFVWRIINIILLLRLKWQCDYAAMKISLIAALSENRVIGKDNRLPWHLPDDMKHFREITEGKLIIVGQRTLESIGKPLPNRTNVVLVREKNTSIPGCVTVHSIEGALEAAKDAKEVVVIGGASVYKQFLEQGLIDKMYLTIVHDTLDGDAYFPEFHLVDWEETYHIHHPKDEQHAYDFSFVTLEKKEK